MKLSPKVEIDLTKRYQRVLKTPASFAFFKAIHNFVEYIESNKAFSKELAGGTKYENLKKIHQGVEDVLHASDKDLGHDRNTVLRDLKRIQGKEASENNAFWKKREVFRRTAVEVYQQLKKEETPD